MAQDSCDPKDKWPRRNDCDTKNIRPRSAGTGILTRTANAGAGLLFRRGLPVPAAAREAKTGVQSSFRRGLPIPIADREASSGTPMIFRNGLPVPILLRTADAGVQLLLRYGLPLPIFTRAANVGLQLLFREGIIPPSLLRPEYHCAIPPEYVLTPVYNEQRQFVYNEDGVLVFCEIRVV